ncbi:MAG: glycosyltransferase family 4 protein [Chloroflexota bacterium]
MRITCVITALRTGGAERVLTIAANYWAKQGDAVTILTLDDSDTTAFPLDARVSHRALALAAVSGNFIVGLRNNARRLRKLRSEIGRTEPDVIVSVQSRTNILVILATLGLRVPIVVCDVSNPAYRKPSQRLWDVLRLLTYPFAFRLIAQTEAARKQYPRLIHPLLEIIPNPVQDHEPRLPSRRPKAETGTIAAMGRFTEEKGFDLLIRAFAAIEGGCPGWNLVIWGDGKLRQELESLARAHGLDDRITMPGFSREPLRDLHEADLFVLSSRSEGMPNVLCEAMSCGLPVVSFDCPNGPAEVIRPGVDGVLVPAEDWRQLAGALERLIHNPDERSRLAERAPDVADRFSLEKVMSRWQQVLDQAAEKRGV